MRYFGYFLGGEQYADSGGQMGYSSIHNRFGTQAPENNRYERQKVAMQRKFCKLIQHCSKASTL